MKLSTLLLLFCCCFSGLCSDKAGMLDSERYQGASLGLYIQELQSGEVMLESQAQKAMIPASVCKLLTVGAAMELLGPKHRFKTELAYSGNIEQDCLKGDLYIIGGGDPSLGSEYTEEQADCFLDEWTKAVQSLGITCIDGDIIADASLFDAEAVSPYWLWEDLGNYYAAGVYGLAVFDNMFRLGLNSGLPGSKPEISYLKPELPQLNISNKLIAKDNNKDSAYFYGAPYSWERVLYGSIPANRRNFEIKGDIPDPPAYLAQRLHEQLIKSGISTKGSVYSNTEPSLYSQVLASNNSKNLPATVAPVVFYTSYSKPLQELVRLINFHSNNLFTEYLLRHLALESEFQVPVSATDGLEVLKRFWAERGVDVSSWQLYDASGLSPLNRLNAESMAAVLSYMALKSPQKDVFMGTLPQASKEGTVINFGKKLPGSLRLKSGSMKSVMNYAGYWEFSGKSYVLVLFCNQHTVSNTQIRKDIEQLLMNIYNTRLK